MIGMKFLIIGCGSIGSRHAQNLKKLGIKNLILCDLNVKRAKLLAKKINSTHVYSSHQEAVKKNPNITAAIISTPTSFHTDLAIYLAKHKINLSNRKFIAHLIYQSRTERKL